MSIIIYERPAPNTARQRTIPAEFLPPTNSGCRGNFNVLGDVKVSRTLVSHSRHLENGATAPKYTDAQLRLMIAEIEVAVEEATAHAQRQVEMLKAILEGKS
jgi:hypothetical protein